jgi:hypothetical protein
MNRIINGLAYCGIALSIVGCDIDIGGDEVGDALAESSLSGYEGRVVSTDTLSGTWVAVGSGSYSFSYNGQIDNEDFSFKEYFVVTGSSADGYQKSSCSVYPNAIVLNNNEISFDNFTGTLTENKSIIGAISETGQYDETTINLSIIKISNATDAIGAIDSRIGSESGNSTDIFCYQQVNGKGLYNEESYGSQYVYTSPVELTSFTGAINYNLLLLSAPLSDGYLDTDNEGESVIFSVNAISNLSETVTFNASNNSTSFTGTIQVDLPQL